MRDYKKYKVWGKSHELVLDIYSLTANFPNSELFGITNQLRRAVVSISNNIAEGSGRNSELEFLRFLNISFASANEVDYLILLSKDLKFIKISEYENMLEKVSEIRRMISGLVKTIKISAIKVDKHQR